MVFVLLLIKEQMQGRVRETSGLVLQLNGWTSPDADVATATTRTPQTHTLLLADC